MTLTATEVGAQELITDLSKKALRSGGASAYVQRLVRNNLTACMTLFDRDVFSLAPGLNYGVGTTNTPLTNATILQAVYNAGLYNLPKPWGGFLHSTQWSQLVNESGSPFAAAAAAGVKAEEFYGNYYIGTFYDVEWWVSSSVSYTNGTTDRCGMILGGDGALGVVWSQMPETTVEHDQSRRADEMLTLAMWAVGEIDGTKGISITSRA